MKLKKELTYIVKQSFKLVSSDKIILIFFYSFALFGLVILDNSASIWKKIPTIVFSLLTIGLSALKVDFLFSIFKGNKPKYKDTLQLLFYYFKKLIGLVSLLTLIFIFLFTLFNFVFYNLAGDNLPSFTGNRGFDFGTILLYFSTLISYLLSIIYFSLFHLFFVILVIDKKQVKESLKSSVLFLRKNILISVIIVSSILFIHYPFSDLLVKMINIIPFKFNHFLVKAFLTLFNVVMDLSFFSIWMVFYKKRS